MQSSDSHEAQSGNDFGFSDFLKSLEEIPWFEHLGEELPEDSGCRRVYSWDEWRGPEEPSVRRIADAQQSLYDELMPGAEADRKKVLWDRIHEVVFRAAKLRVSYDDGLDIWHPPNMAVWHAAWTAGLVGMCLFEQRSFPQELETQWNWFKRGHWPCDWKGDMPGGQPIVF